MAGALGGGKLRLNCIHVLCTPQGSAESACPEISYQPTKPLVVEGGVFRPFVAERISAD